MKINFTPLMIETIKEIQDNPILVGIMEDAENFILENVDIDCDEDGKLSKKALDNVKGLRSVRKLLEKICTLEADE